MSWLRNMTNAVDKQRAVLRQYLNDNEEKKDK